MKIVQTDEIPLKRGLEHRGGIFHGRIMVEGEPGALDNFQLSFGQMGGDFNSPRHRHNFEQIRYQLEGVLDYGRDGKLTAGMVGYFPEAVYYGPQSQDPNIPCKTIVLQFGGASGSGYLSAGRGAGRHAGAQARGRVQGRRVPPPRRCRGQAQRRRLPGDLGARQRSADGLSQAALSAADLYGPDDLRLGAARRARPGCARSRSACSRNGAAKPASSGSMPARASPRAARASMSSPAARARSAASRCARSPRSMSTPAKPSPSRRRRRPSSCISACPISPACACPRTSRSHVEAAE